MSEHLARRVTPSSLKMGVAGAQPPVSVVSQVTLDAGKVETRFADGTRLVRFRNGTEKETTVGDEQTMTVRFANGDVKRTAVAGGGIETYWYADANTLQTTYPAVIGMDVGMGADGQSTAYDIYEFVVTGQVERHVNGVTVELAFAEGN